MYDLIKQAFSRINLIHDNTDYVIRRKKVKTKNNFSRIDIRLLTHHYKYIWTMDCTAALHKGQGSIVLARRGRSQLFLSLCFLTRAMEHSVHTHAWPQGRNTFSTCQKKDKILIGKSR